MGNGAAPWTASAAGRAEWCSACYVTVTSEGCPQPHLTLCLCQVFYHPVNLGETLSSLVVIPGLCVLLHLDFVSVQRDLFVRVCVDFSGHRVNFGSLNWELCFSALNKTSRKWDVSNSVASLAIWLSSAALFFLNFKFGVPTNDACTAEIHNPFAVWKGITEILKQFSENLKKNSYIYIGIGLSSLCWCLFSTSEKIGVLLGKPSCGILWIPWVFLI